MPPVVLYPMRLTFYCPRGCTLRFLTTRIADVALDTCPTCGAPLRDDAWELLVTRPCCGTVYREPCAIHCPKARRSA